MFNIENYMRFYILFYWKNKTKAFLSICILVSNLKIFLLNVFFSNSSVIWELSTIWEDKSMIFKYNNEGKLNLLIKLKFDDGTIFKKRFFTAINSYYLVFFVAILLINLNGYDY